MIVDGLEAPVCLELDFRRTFALADARSRILRPMAPGRRLALSPRRSKGPDPPEARPITYADSVAGLMVGREIPMRSATIR